MKTINGVVRRVAEQHCMYLEYQSPAWRKSMAYWIRECRALARRSK